ncbi:MAG: transcriptional regulator [Deltaproteobacteria bacterium]|nr:transcriptional regulator [Deltaproteobacteria bacterium]
MPELNKIIHERSRLLILTHLASNTDVEVSFNDIKEKLDFTPGNLSIQLKKLDEAGYITIRKSFRDNKPHTAVIITPKGIKALNSYLEEMEELIKGLRG